ncbi:MAG: exodeoxyribonuclease V subunit alpha [Victivallales bacterium]|nr:exodeoxyribonuclease V subunit alpha [Victivallales bacterium]
MSETTWISLQDSFLGLHGLSFLAREFADMILRQTIRIKGGDVPASDQECLWLLAAMSCAAMEASNSCLLLQNPDVLDEKLFTQEAQDYAQLSLWAEADAVEPQRSCDFREIYRRWPQIVHKYPETICEEMPSSQYAAPLCLVQQNEKTRLYLSRYRAAEREFCKCIQPMLAQETPAESVPPERIAASCTLFQHAGMPHEANHQIQAVAKALRSHFFIITGGPGTGKTTVLTVFLAWMFQQNPEWKVALCAPTGKASDRMTQAIRDGIQNLTGEINASIQNKLRELSAVTVHKLLRINTATGQSPYHQNNHLNCELVVVDECSMCDLTMMTQLLQALPPEARLLLLGDADQLASVENGTVLADLCRWMRDRQKNDFYERLEECYRFPASSPLGGFVRELIQKDGKPDYDGLYQGTTFQRAPNQTSCLFQGFSPKTLQKRDSLQQALRQTKTSSEKLTLPDALKMLLEACGIDWKTWKSPRGTSDWQEREWVAYYYNRAESVKLLCAVRKGSWGVKQLNAAMQTCLGISSKANGMPVMITRNDPVTGLNNGDIGVYYHQKIWFPKRGKEGCLSHTTMPEATRNLLGKYAHISFVAFEEAQLPDYEDAFAMTIHKSQGSGYDNVLLFLPEKDNPILTRELIYTGITRTQQNCLVIANQELLKTAANRQTLRWTGLQELLP